MTTAGRRWRVLAAAVLFQTTGTALAVTGFTFFVNGWALAFAMPVSQITLAFTLLGVGVVFAAPLVGSWCDRHSLRGLVAAGLLASALGCMLIGFADAGWQILAVYGALLPFAVLLTGAPVAQSLVARWFQDGQGRAMGVAATGIGLPGLLAPPLIVMLLGRQDWRDVWFAFAAFLLVAILPLTWVMIGRTPPASIVSADGQRPDTGLSTAEILSRRNFWIAMAVYAGVQIPVTAMLVNLAPFAADRGVEGQSVAGAYMAYAVVAMLANLGAGLLTDRLGLRVPLVLTALAGSGGLLVLSVAHDGQSLAIAFVLLGCSGGIWTVLSATTASEYGTASFGKAFGLMSMLAPAAAFGPPLLAVLREQSGSYAPALCAFAAVAFATGLAALLYRRPERNRLA